MKTAIELTSLLLVGWIAGAEVGSWCCVQPVLARLPYEQYVAAEQANAPHVRPHHACADAAQRRTSDRVGCCISRREEFRGVASCCRSALSRPHRRHHATVNVPINTRTVKLASDQRRFGMAGHARAVARLRRRSRRAFCRCVCAPQHSAGYLAGLERLGFRPWRAPGLPDADVVHESVFEAVVVSANFVADDPTDLPLEFARESTILQPHYPASAVTQATCLLAQLGSVP